MPIYDMQCLSCDKIVELVIDDIVPRGIVYRGAQCNCGSNQWIRTEQPAITADQSISWKHSCRHAPAREAAE